MERGARSATRRSAAVDPDAYAARARPEIERRGHVGRAAGSTWERLRERVPVEGVADEGRMARSARDVVGDVRPEAGRLREDANAERVKLRGRRPHRRRRFGRHGGQAGRSRRRDGAVVSEEPPAAGRRRCRPGAGADHKRAEHRQREERSHSLTARGISSGSAHRRIGTRSDASARPPRSTRSPIEASPYPAAATRTSRRASGRTPATRGAAAASPGTRRRRGTAQGFRARR